MEPISIYLLGVLLTGLIAGHADTTTTAAASGVGATTSMGAGAIALTWPVSVPVLAMAGAANEFKPDVPAKRDLIGVNSDTPPASQDVACRTREIPVAQIEAATGGYQGVAGGSMAILQDVGGVLPQGAGLTFSTVNWRGGATWQDAAGIEPRVVVDWVGNGVDGAGEEVAKMRTCTLQAGSQK